MQCLCHWGGGLVQCFLKYGYVAASALQLLPRQPIKTSTAGLRAVKAFVQLAFKAVQDVGHVGKACGIQCFTSVNRALAAAANQKHGAGFIARL